MIVIGQLGMTDKPHCFNCTHWAQTNDSEYGDCVWFYEINKQPKAIPEHIFDRGCKYFKDKKTEDLIKHIIEVFDGELIR